MVFVAKLNKIFLFLPVVLWTIMLCTLHNMPNWGKSTADWILHAGEKNYDRLLLSKKFLKAQTSKVKRG